MDKKEKEKITLIILLIGGIGFVVVGINSIIFGITHGLDITLSSGNILLGLAWVGYAGYYLFTLNKRYASKKK